jgi:hypothetical protein
MRGRPTLYTAEMADEILARLANGEPLKTICRDDHLPSASTVRGWVMDDREGFSGRYARAKDLGLEANADEIMELPDDFTGETPGDIAKLRAQLDSRKWLLSKLKPERYGDSLKLTGQIDLTHKTDDQLDARIAQLLGQAGAGGAAGGEGAPGETP